MGTISVHVKACPRSAGLKKMFVVNFLLIMLGVCIATSISEWFVLILLEEIRFSLRSTGGPILLLTLVGTPPCVFLGLAALLFSSRAERAISQPVHELQSAVEKIRQKDLNFHIQYDKANELGNLCRALNTLRDELQTSLEREWARQEEMHLMVAALAHDLRTPVTIIQGHVEGLARAGTRQVERLERYLPVLESCSQRMMKFLNELLLLNALEQTDFLIQPQPTHLQMELERKAKLYEIQAHAQNLCFQVTLQPGLLPVTLDLHRLEQIMDNLFENALRHTPPEGLIALECSWENELLVEIRDTGEGIAQEDLPHLFEKFYHGKSQKRRSEYASGLGLCICKLLVEKQGGCLTIANAIDGGCVARFLLPLGMA